MKTEPRGDIFERRSRGGRVLPKTAQDYADLVTRALDQAVAQILMAGEMLARAKKQLDHGEWSRMFRDHDNAVARPLPFGARAAQMLMAIAAHPLLSDANHGSLLPTSWRTLYELTRLPDPVLEAALTDGLIHPALERKHVAGLPGAVAARGGPCMIRTEASTPATQDFNRLRAEVLARPALARRWQAHSRETANAGHTVVTSLGPNGRATA